MTGMEASEETAGSNRLSRNARASPWGPWELKREERVRQEFVADTRRESTGMLDQSTF